MLLETITPDISNGINISRDLSCEDQIYRRHLLSETSYLQKFSFLPKFMRYYKNEIKTLQLGIIRLKIYLYFFNETIHKSWIVTKRKRKI